MGISKGVTFVYPYKGRLRKWVVVQAILNRWQAEVVDGRFAGRKANFDTSHIERMVHLQSLLKAEELEGAGKRESNNHRRCSWTDRAIQETAPSFHGTNSANRRYGNRVQET